MRPGSTSTSPLADFTRTGIRRSATLTRPGCSGRASLASADSAVAVRARCPLDGRLPGPPGAWFGICPQFPGGYGGPPILTASPVRGQDARPPGAVVERLRDGDARGVDARAAHQTP